MDKRLQFKAFVNMAGCYTCMAKVNMSIIYFKKSISFAHQYLLKKSNHFSKIKDELWSNELDNWVERDVAVSLFNLTNALLQKGSTKEALNYATKSND